MSVVTSLFLVDDDKVDDIFISLTDNGVTSLIYVLKNNK